MDGGPLGRAVFRHYAVEQLPYPEIRISVQKRSDRVLLEGIIRGYDRVRRVFEEYGLWHCGECGIEVGLGSSRHFGSCAKWMRYHPSSEPLHWVFIRTSACEKNPAWTACFVFSDVATHCFLGHPTKIPSWIEWGVPQFMTNQMEQESPDFVSFLFEENRFVDGPTWVSKASQWQHFAQRMRHPSAARMLYRQYVAGETVKVIVRQVGLRRFLMSARDAIIQGIDDPKKMTKILLSELRIDRLEIDRLVRLHLAWGWRRPESSDVTVKGRGGAVMIEYDSGQGQAPRVVAVGKGRTASVLLRYSADSGIPIWKDAQLASTLIKSVSLNDSIPRSLFAPVAQILAQVYRLRNRASD